MALTITEALAEIKTIDARITRAQDFVRTYLVRQRKIIDPLDSEGGSVAAIERQRQSLRDLRERRIALRSAIARSNQNMPVTIEGVSRSVADWIVWKREIAPGLRQEYASLAGYLDGIRTQARQKNISVGGDAPDDVIVNVQELALSEERDLLEKILGTLDGQLSLINARTEIEVR